MSHHASVHPFLAESLPFGGRDHVLSLGEQHTDVAHLDYLRQRLPQLRLGTIGLERPTFMNAALWACEDGVLGLSAAEMAGYLGAYFAGISEDENVANAHATGHLAAEAIAGGSRMVAFDGRRNLAAMRADNKECVTLYKRLVTILSERFEQPESAIAEGLRHRPALLDQMAAELRMDRAMLHYGWVLQETETLLQEHPAYRQRLDAMETIMREGTKRKLSTDALAAVIFDAARVPGANSMTVSGLAHVVGVPAKGYSALPDHLAAMRAAGKPAPTVKRGLLATTSMVQAMQPYTQLPWMLRGTLPAANIDTGGVEPFGPSSKPPPKGIRMTGKHLDPTLVSPIAKAADAIRRSFAGQEMGAQR